MSSSIRLLFTGPQVDCTRNTSEPRTDSDMETEISPSAKVEMAALPIGSPSAERSASQCGWELFRMGMQEQYGLDGEKITIERNAHGKPYLPGHPQICFNISHSGEYAACAFASIPIGMDLQQHRRAAWERMAERYFSAEDQKRLAAAENAETLFSGSGPRRRATASGGNRSSGSLGTEKKEGFCTHFSPEKGYEGAVWAAEPVKICMKRIEP